MAKQKTAVIQVRVSSKGQAEKELPIESQLARCEDMAKSLGATVLRVFSEEGRSGWSGPRPDFEDAIEYCEKVFPDYFITWSTSRFSRNQAVSVGARARLERIGCELLYASFDAGSDPDTKFLNIGMRELMDEYYSRQTSRDTKRSMARNAESGYWNGGRVPYGYKPSPDKEHPKRKRLVIDPVEAETVKKIFAMRISGAGSKAIAVALNQQGLKNRDREWKRASVLSVLNSDAVRGCIVYGKRAGSARRVVPRDQWLVIKSHEPIISEDQWQQVQAIMEGSEVNIHGSSARSAFVFAGLIKCDQCGGGLQIETATGRGGKNYSYYNCRNAVKNGSCQSRRFSAEEMDSFLIDAICRRVLTRRNLSMLLEEMQKELGAWSNEQKQQISVLRQEYQDLERKNEKLYATIESMGNDAPDPKFVVRRININSSRMEIIQEQITKIENTPAPDLSIRPEDLDDLANFMKGVAYTAVKPQRVRAFFGALVKNIIITDRQAKIAYRGDFLLAKSNRFAMESDWLPGTRLLRTKSFRVDLPERWQRRVA